RSALESVREAGDLYPGAVSAVIPYVGEDPLEQLGRLALHVDRDDVVDPRMPAGVPVVDAHDVLAARRLASLPGDVLVVLSVDVAGCVGIEVELALRRRVGPRAIVDLGGAGESARIRLDD